MHANKLVVAKSAYLVTKTKAWIPFHGGVSFAKDLVELPTSQVPIINTLAL